MISDGITAHAAQDLERAKRPVYRHTTHYERIWRVLTGAGLKMMGEHSEPGGIFEIQDAAGTRVGEVTFTAADEFAAGRFYADYVSFGRTTNRNQAASKFVDVIEESHARRR